MSLSLVRWDILQIGDHAVDLHHAVRRHTRGSGAKRRSFPTQERDSHCGQRIAQVVDSQVAIRIAVLYHEWNAKRVGKGIGRLFEDGGSVSLACPRATDRRSSRLKILRMIHQD